MGRRAHVGFRDDELVATLPDALALYHVASDDAPWAIGWAGKRTDWAWQEPGRFLLCELKDPECRGALAHPAAPGQKSRVQHILRMLTGASFPNEFALKAAETIARLPPAAAAATNRTFVVLAAITDPTFDVVTQQAAALTIESHLKKLGCPMPVIVVNIAEWNRLLTPRAVVRDP